MVVVDNAVFEVDVVFGPVLAVVLAKKNFFVISFLDFSRFLGFVLF